MDIKIIILGVTAALMCFCVCLLTKRLRDDKRSYAAVVNAINAVRELSREKDAELEEKLGKLRSEFDEARQAIGESAAAERDFNEGLSNLMKYGADIPALRGVNERDE